MLPSSVREERRHERGHDAEGRPAHARASRVGRRSRRGGRRRNQRQGSHGQERQHFREDGQVLDPRAPAHAGEVRPREDDDQQGGESDQREPLGRLGPHRGGEVLGADHRDDPDGPGLDGGGVAEYEEKRRHRTVRVAQDRVLGAARMVEPAELGKGQSAAESDRAAERPREQGERGAVDELRDARGGEEDPDADDRADDDARCVDGAEDARGALGGEDGARRSHGAKHTSGGGGPLHRPSGRSVVRVRDRRVGQRNPIGLRSVIVVACRPVIQTNRTMTAALLHCQPRFDRRLRSKKPREGRRRWKIPH